MPSGESVPGTTWRPIEAATTPWVPNLKLPATKLSKNIITQHSTLQAISMPTSNLLPANECTYRSLIPKTLPWPSPNPLSWLSHLACKLFQKQADVYCGDNPVKLSYAKSSSAG